MVKHYAIIKNSKVFIGKMWFTIYVFLGFEWATD